MTGIGALVGPFRWLMGKDLSHSENMFLAGENMGPKRYLRYTTDHKVVGIQYLFITILIFFLGGGMAMLIRTNLGTPEGGWLHPQAYNAIVGTHGILMIVGTIIMVTGPFGNFIMPIMIGYSDKASTYASAEQMFLAHVVHCLAPWAERIEQARGVVGHVVEGMEVVDAIKRGNPDLNGKVIEPADRMATVTVAE